MKARFLEPIAASAALIALLSLSPTALGRPGGGHSFSGGSHSFGGGSHSFGGGSHSFGGGSHSFSGGSNDSGGGSGDASELLVLLFLGVPVLLIAAIAQASNKSRGMQQGWEAGVASFRPPPPPRPRISPRAMLDKLREVDPDFSPVLFEDFLYSLYHAFHEARGGQANVRMEPYLSPAVQQILEGSRRRGVNGIVVGAMTIAKVGHEVRNGEPWALVTVEYEANMTEVGDDGKEQGFCDDERWRLARRAAAKSRSPDKALLTQCPSCGAALESMQGNVCGYCQATLTPGQFDWCLEHIEAERETRPPILTNEAPERGTDLPTVVSDGAQGRYQQLCERDPAFSWQLLQPRVGAIFDHFQQGWVARDWRPFRPYLSDPLFQSQLYWIEEYKRQKLINRTDGAHILGIQLADVRSDKYFDSVTVRLFAAGADFTVDESGKVISGSAHKQKSYSEYWTLIRRAGAQGEAKGERQCPSCGAELHIGMAGNCEYCHAKVTSGQFDWVLSRIEQDEVYQG